VGSSGVADEVALPDRVGRVNLHPILRRQRFVPICGATVAAGLVVGGQHRQPNHPTRRAAYEPPVPGGTISPASLIWLAGLGGGIFEDHGSLQELRSGGGLGRLGPRVAVSVERTEGRKRTSGRPSGWRPSGVDNRADNTSPSRRFNFFKAAPRAGNRYYVRRLKWGCDTAGSEIAGRSKAAYPGTRPHGDATWRAARTGLPPGGWVHVPQALEPAESLELASILSGTDLLPLSQGLDGRAAGPDGRNGDPRLTWRSRQYNAELRPATRGG